MNIITEQELARYGQTWSLSRKAIALVNQQKATWLIASENYRCLRSIKIRNFDFGNFHMECQFNPGRIRSSAANTSAEAILSRPCFLCNENRPQEQLNLPYGQTYLILTNPFPIFPYHLTISSSQHTPQRIDGNLQTFLEISQALDEFTLFYNGPQCGASAPDHLHFQAGIREILPIENDLEFLLREHSGSLVESRSIAIHAVHDSLRRFIYFHSEDRDLLAFSVSEVISLMGDGQGEPMLNILNWFSENKWHVLIFPRALQRPWQYFADDPEKIVISPAAVELGGIIVLPREEDFHKIRVNDLKSIFNQITLPEKDFKVLQEKIVAGLSQKL
jgi:hypothetical protein